MDALSEVLREVHLTGGVFLHAEFNAPWCITVQVTHEHCGPVLGGSSHLIPYHYVVEGIMHVQVEGGEAAVLRAGEILLLPRNDRHTMGSDLALPPASAGELIQRSSSGGLASIRHGGDGAGARMICGFLACDDFDGNPMLSALPSSLTLDVESGDGADWIRSTFRYAAAEVGAGRPGSEAVLVKLSEVLFVEAVRRHAQSLPPNETGWLAGLRDPHIARALALLHRDCAREWTLDEIGREVGLSRSVLADRFARLIGLPPMQYLAGCRMQLAARKLRESQASLARIAEAVGYESEAAFSRAFKKTFGAAPATWRRVQG
ncbi:AraC family transcriptional regulator [Enhydrobacter sp.]|jgi:AraC-like DNA-binding protein|uniref:AraC family transcriptional regulator n=1 Tax=Enhydrobacter sp. TaxID=1894999 RepID=UPI00261A4307|nr:AraC family transcriptional regulator [Enhydrobacter sp.]WIM09229.1 MAG: Transcriptional regulator, AraC family [Enhydrobacter sp.]